MSTGVLTSVIVIPVIEAMIILGLIAFIVHRSHTSSGISTQHATSSPIIPSSSPSPLSPSTPTGAYVAVELSPSSSPVPSSKSAA
jgi:hypothetical protein